MSEIQMGDVVRDTVTGFEGVAVASTKWRHGKRKVATWPTN